MKTVAQVMAALPEALDPQGTIHQAARMMRDGDYGAVPIVDAQGTLVGIVTDRDIVVKAVAEGRDGDTPVRHCMSGTPDTVGTDTTVEQAMIVMTSRQIRRLPVMEQRPPGRHGVPGRPGRHGRARRGKGAGAGERLRRGRAAPRRHGVRPLSDFGP